ncbi:TetR family transcriptional regulator [Phytohabitans suffuscus]|uniref:TetR family transcriptional regulator n=1 Tax=Phytohabitans suffuscus TaxID=624315 RepID=A0A6F8YYV0_9ACTN|nr:TetR family transcriptional regulator [Phytohabitans suffuscus]BCB91246.1 TetR family transcriptional regulator [Phytohabitans suffuscus]
MDGRRGGREDGDAGTWNGDPRRRGRGVALGHRGQPTRGPRPALTLAGIAGAAIRVADEEGLDAVSMQRVAAALDVTKMALYRYVASKAELFAVMTEIAVGEPPVLSGVRGGWRRKLERWAELLRTTWREHPWIPAVTLGDRLMGPRETGWTEAAVAALEGTGLTGAERMDAVSLLGGHVRNTRSAAGTQPWTADRRLSPLLADLVRRDKERFPALVAAIDEAGRRPDDSGWTFGLARILDGIEQLVASRSGD